MPMTAMTMTIAAMIQPQGTSSLDSDAAGEGAVVGTAGGGAVVVPTTGPEARTDNVGRGTAVVASFVGASTVGCDRTGDEVRSGNAELPLPPQDVSAAAARDRISAAANRRTSTCCGLRSSRGCLGQHDRRRVCAHDLATEPLVALEALDQLLDHLVGGDGEDG